MTVSGHHDHRHRRRQLHLANTTATTTADITPRPLTVSATGVNKVYDGTTAATVTLSDDRVAGDVFTDTYATATFADKNVGTGKTVTRQRHRDQRAPTRATTPSAPPPPPPPNITPAALTVSATRRQQGLRRHHRRHRRPSPTTASPATSSPTPTARATFADKNVGTGKTVASAASRISGADAGNYTLANTTATTTANITAAPLTVSATGVNKVYDGTTAATVTLTDNRVAGDVFTAAYAGATSPTRTWAPARR